MSQAFNQLPSNIIGLTAGSYEAYCFDQAVYVGGSQMQADIDRAGKSPSKEQRDEQRARESALSKYFGTKPKKQQFADPAALFAD